MTNKKHNWNYFKHHFYFSHTEKFGNGTTYWQDFHQGSAISRTDTHSSSIFRMGMENIKKIQSLMTYDPYRCLPLIPLPEASKIDNPLGEAIIQRRSCRDNMTVSILTFQDLADFLYYGYGRNPRGMKNVPSGGALYPLDIYVYCANVDQLEQGLYYYVSQKHGLKFLFDKKDDIKGIFSDMEIYNTVKHASAYIFISSVFFRNIWKYSERGYRFTLLEAGHVAQNLNLIASAKGVDCLNIGGFYDLETNQFLDLDGSFDASLYIVCLGYTDKD